MKNNEKNMFSQKKKIIKQLCNYYVKSHKNSDLAVNKIISLFSRNEFKEKNNDKMERLSQFESILMKLDSDAKEIIIHEFIFNDKNGWSDDFWSRRKYYKIREKTINNFLNYLYEN
ncbi:MAG: MG284/MPN403 family protein [Metamycoplasmataceae bacterium]